MAESPPSTIPAEEAPKCGTCSSGDARSAVRSPSVAPKTTSTTPARHDVQRALRGQKVGVRGSTTMAFVAPDRAAHQRHEDRQARRAHRPRRSAHLRHGLAFSARSASTRQGPEVQPIDKSKLLYYREAKDGQMLEEGITEAGSMAIFIAAGTSYSDHGVPMIPFYHVLFDVRLPAHRRPDWAAGDCMARGFMLGAHRRPHHAERRRPAARRRSQPAPGASTVPNCSPTIPRTRTSSRSSSKTACIA